MEPHHFTIQRSFSNLRNTLRNLSRISSRTFRMASRTVPRTLTSIGLRNEQASKCIASLFEYVIATDASTNQIAHTGRRKCNFSGCVGIWSRMAIAIYHFHLQKFPPPEFKLKAHWSSASFHRLLSDMVSHKTLYQKQEIQPNF